MMCWFVSFFWWTNKKMPKPASYPTSIHTAFSYGQLCISRVVLLVFRFGALICTTLTWSTINDTAFKKLCCMHYLLYAEASAAVVLEELLFWSLFMLSGLLLWKVVTITWWVFGVFLFTRTWLVLYREHCSTELRGILFRALFAYYFR